MAYSRWSDSHWYTYGYGRDGEKTKENEIFCIQSASKHGKLAFTYGELRDNLDRCLEMVWEYDADGDLEELRGYMQEFLDDVENGTLEE